MEPAMSGSALRSFYLRSFPRPLSVLFLVVIFATASFADSHARIVRLSYIDGDVELDKGDGHGFNTAYVNMPIVHQSKLWARDGQAEVEFEDGSSIRLAPDTILAFSNLSLNGGGGHSTAVELVQGTAYFDVRRHESDSFEVQVGHPRVQLTKSARFRVDADKHESEIAVMSGEVEVSNGANEVAVKKGETIRLDTDDPDRYRLAKGIDPENFDAWDNERTNGHDQAVSTAVWGGNSSTSYGLSDLNAYGRYFYVPGYGYMWRPASASLAWDPFTNGYWVSYPGFGYTFVSGYPWGWAPYRYGEWQFLNGYGWCWAPGSNWNNWNTIPAVRNGPPHFRPPQAPRNGPPVVVIDHGTTSPAPPRRIVVDNDALEHHRLPSRTMVTETGEAMRGGAPSTTSSPGFVSPPAATPIAPVGTPAVVTVGPSRQVAPHFGSGRRADEGRDERRDEGLNPAPVMIRGIAPANNNSPTAARTVVPPATAAPIAPRAIEPRMEPRLAPPPAGRMETRSMGSSPSMGASHSISAPSMSSGGGIRMSPSAPGGNTGGGGGHASSGSSSGGGRNR